MQKSNTRRRSLYISFTRPPGSIEKTARIYSALAAFSLFYPGFSLSLRRELLNGLAQGRDSVGAYGGVTVLPRPLERQEALRCFFTSSAVDSWHDDQLEGEALAVRVASRVRSRIASTTSASIFAASAETLTLDTTRPFPSSSQRERSSRIRKASSQARRANGIRQRIRTHLLSR